MIDRNTKKTRFSDFLSGEYARDYINQELPYGADRAGGRTDPGGGLCSARRRSRDEHGSGGGVRRQIL